MMRHQLWVIAVLAGCASGGTPDPNQQPDAAHHDGHFIPTDSPLPIDAPHEPIDAKVFLDAPPQVDGGIPGLCTDNTQCTTAGDCCFVAVCVPGTAVGVSLCFPN